jgi:Mitochondrial import 2
MIQSSNTSSKFGFQVRPLSRWLRWTPNPSRSHGCEHRANPSKAIPIPNVSWQRGLSMSLNPLSFPPLPSQEHPPESASPLSSSIIQVSPQHSRSPSPSRSPTPTASTASTDDEDDLAEQEWQESLAQLALLFNLVLLPFAGKYFGRKFAYFSTSTTSPVALFVLCWGLTCG